MIDTIMNFLVDIASHALELLPDSPFANLEFEGLTKFEEIMGWINYVIPFGIMVNILLTYLVAVGVWYVARWLLRLAQYID